MANFDEALQITLHHEGGYANNPKDRGGETYAGIARKFNPQWEGWEIIDAIPDNQKYNNAKFSDIKLLPAIASFYAKKYWSKILGDSINNQQVANVIFDWSVNSGGAIKQIQQLIGVVVDGYVGNKTIAAINECDPERLVRRICAIRKSYYKTGVADGWLDRLFLDGLLARADKYAVGKSQDAA